MDEEVFNLLINPHARRGHNEWWKFVDTGSPG